jgi:hypothetical protein
MVTNRAWRRSCLAAFQTRLAASSGVRVEMGKRRPGHVEKRGDKYRLVVEAGPDPVTGKRRQITRRVAARNSKEAHRSLANLLAEVASGRHGRATDAKTVAELCQEWLELACPNVEPTQPGSGKASCAVTSSPVSERFRSRD